MRLSLLCVVLLTAGSVVAQQPSSDDAFLLFPPDSELIRAAQVGYRTQQQSRMGLVYQPSDRDRAYFACSPWPQEVRAAGPILLAAMEGETARVHSRDMPSSAEILHASGTLLLQLVIFSRHDGEQVTVTLMLGPREFQPLRAFRNKVESVPCESHWNGGQDHATRVQETFTFGFEPAQIQPGWSHSAKLIVRRPGHLEICKLDLQRVLMNQAKSAGKSVR